MYCKKCGKEISKNAVFCGNCGHRTEDGKSSNVSSEKKIKAKGKRKIWIIIGMMLLVLIVLTIGFILKNELFKMEHKEKKCRNTR